MRRIALWVSAILIVVTAAPAAAQQRLFAISHGRLFEIGVTPSSFGRVQRQIALPEGFGMQARDVVPLAGGAALAWAQLGGVVFYDLRTGLVQRHQVPGFIPLRVLGADASSFRVLVHGKVIPSGETQTHVLIADLRTLTTRLLDLGDVPGSVLYASRANALFVAHPRSGGGSNVDVIDVDAGVLLRQLSVPPGGLAVSEDGTRLYVSGDRDARTYDVVSGALLASRDGLGSATETLVDEGRGRVLRLSQSRTDVLLSALTAETLTPLGAVRLPAPPLAETFPSKLVSTWDVSPRSATIFAFETMVGIDNLRRPICGPAMFVALDAASGGVRAAEDFGAATGLTGCEWDLVRVTEPAAPASFAANVSGHRVSFSWGAEAATHYVIEAGVAPGATNLTIPVTSTQLVIDDVPAGVYHVRVRALNVIGPSAASQEIRVVIE